MAPIDEYRELKDDQFAALGFLDSQDLLLRIAAIFAAVFIPSLALTTYVYPPFGEQGELFFPNVAAALVFAAASGSSIVFAVVISLTQKFDNVTKSLQRSSYYVEFDGTKGLDYGGGAGGAYSYTRTKTDEQQQKDKLIAETETEPATGRLRTYLLGSIATTIVSFTVAGNVGGVARPAAEEEGLLVSPSSVA